MVHFFINLTMFSLRQMFAMHYSKGTYEPRTLVLFMWGTSVRGQVRCYFEFYPFLHVHVHCMHTHQQQTQRLHNVHSWRQCTMHIVQWSGNRSGAWVEGYFNSHPYMDLFSRQQLVHYTITMAVYIDSTIMVVHHTNRTTMTCLVINYHCY